AKKLYWHENVGGQTFVAHTIPNVAVALRNVAPVDFDGDGDVDLVAVSISPSQLLWFENDGSQQFTTRLVATDVRGAAAIDMDRDGDIDLVGARSTGVTWFENNGAQQFSERQIGALSQPGTTVATRDLD